MCESNPSPDSKCVYQLQNDLQIQINSHDLEVRLLLHLLNVGYN